MHVSMELSYVSINS